MSFLKCCVGADPRPAPESIRPVGASSNPNRRAGRAGAVSGGGAMRQDPLGGNKKLKMPNEVFFDPSKPDGQLSSVTDPPTSAREYTDGKKRKDHKDRSGMFIKMSSSIYSTVLFIAPCKSLLTMEMIAIVLRSTCVARNWKSRWESYWRRKREGRLRCT